MGESPKSATADVDIGHGGIGAQVWDTPVGDGALLRGGGTCPSEGDHAVAFMRGETVRFEHGLANAAGAGIRITILEMEAFSFYRARREMSTGRQKLSVRGLRGMAQVRAEGDDLGSPRVIGEVREPRHGEGADNAEQTDCDHQFDQGKAGA
jgi:hypothetical protein